MGPVEQRAGIIGQRLDVGHPDVRQAPVRRAPHRLLRGRVRLPAAVDHVAERAQLLADPRGHVDGFIGQQVAQLVLVHRAVGGGDQDLQAPGALGHLIQGQAGRALVDGHVADMVAFVEHQQHVRGRGDQRLAVVAFANGKGRQQQRVIGDHDLGVAHGVARAQHGALGGVGALAPRTAGGRGGDARTQRGADGVGRVVQVAIPAAFDEVPAQLLRQVHFNRRQRAVEQRLFVLEHAFLRAIAMRFSGIARAQVAGAALGQRHGGLQAGGLEEVRDVAHDQLRLQRHGASADHQLFLRGQRNRHAGGEIAQALTHAGGRLDHPYPAALRQRTRDHADHLALRTPRAEAGGIGLQLGVGIADDGLELVVQRTRGFNFFGHAGEVLPGSGGYFLMLRGRDRRGFFRAGSDP